MPISLEWYDNICMLMMNSVNGGGVPETGEVTSVCLMRAGSFVNHSDDPCCAILPNRDGYSNIAFIALREIAPGEEVTISYVDPSLTLDERDKLLATQYFILPQRGRKDDSHSSKIAKFRAKAQTEKAMAKAISHGIQGRQATRTLIYSQALLRTVRTTKRLQLLLLRLGHRQKNQSTWRSMNYNPRPRD